MTSTWSLHRQLGQVMYEWPDIRARAAVDEAPKGALDLLELPAQLAARGIGMLEICHFHFPRLDDGYIADLRQALATAGIELFSILIDAGDITHPDAEQRQKEMLWIGEWLEIAARCGARCARVVAGISVAHEPGEWHASEVVKMSAANLRHLAALGRTLGVEVLTENFQPLAASAGVLNAILDLCVDEVGLCVDFGNLKGPNKYRDLAALLPRATSVHAKADFPAVGQMDREDFAHCLSLAQNAGFAGPYSLIFSSPGEEWEGLEQTQSFVEEWLEKSSDGAI